MEKDLSTLKHLHAELLDTLRNYFNYPFYSNDARLALIYKLVSETELAEICDNSLVYNENVAVVS